MSKFTLPALLLLLALSSPAAAGFEEGRSAYNSRAWEKAILELRPLAEGGNDRALLLIANMYYHGYGVIRDYREALSLYRRAAGKNNTEAMLALGAMYTSASGVNQNLNAAAQWFLRAAQLGDRTGAYFYATILFRGNKNPADEIKPDFYTAYKWFRICAAGPSPPEYKEDAEKMAAALAKLKLTAEAAAQADREAAEWKPLDAASLGPLPAEPENN